MPRQNCTIRSSERSVVKQYNPSALQMQMQRLYRDQIWDQHGGSDHRKQNNAIICTDKPAVTTRIATLLRAEFPDTVILSRAFDRAHALDLLKLGIDHQIRETFESALALSREALELMDVSAEDAHEVIDGVRKRDRERFALQMAGDIYAGSSLLIGNAKDQASGR